MDQFQSQANPGFANAILTVENQFIWGFPDVQVYRKGIVLDSTTVDVGASPTTDCRAGLALGIVTSTGKAKQYDPTATDGTQVFAGFLGSNCRMFDSGTGAVADRVPAGGIVVGAPVIVSKVFGLDTYARRQANGRFFWDDLYFPSVDELQAVAKTADYTVVNDTDNKKRFTTLGAAGAVNFTLPTTLKRGQAFEFFNEANQNMTVTAPAGKLVAFNNAAATSVALSTAGQKIGGGFRITVNSDATKYMAEPIVAGHTVTVA